MNAANLPSVAELDAAARTVYEAMPPTPQYAWPLLAARLGTKVWVKHENHTPTGAFKVRGGLVYFAMLAAAEPACPGVVSATRGNHGQSIGFAARRHGLAATIVVPHGNSREKNAAMRALGVELIEHGDDFQEAREFAGRLAAGRALHFVPSFHRNLVLGVASYCMEFLRAVPDLEVVYVPIGQGSGVASMIAARAALGRRVEIVGVVSDHAPAYALSFAARKAVSHDVSTELADGLACRVPDEEALALILANVSRIVRVTDAEVAGAMRALFADTHNAAEGAGAAGFAAAMQERKRLRGRIVGVVACGGNVDSDMFARVLAGGCA
ncbi:MAG: threonine dehydratase [Burkholderiales bacterium]|jgi:threonine dehydratase|nr:threonine dehydratase [Burkholderiales bacterium]